MCVAQDAIGEVAVWGVELLSVALPNTLPVVDAGAEVVRPAIAIEGRALVFALAISIGAALIFAGVGSMAAAAVVLLASAPDKARAALTQGTFPVIAVVLLVIGLVTR